MTPSIHTPQSNGASTSLEVHLLGIVDFDSAMFLQERLVYEISGRSDTLGALLLCEHPPLITVGREGSRADILADPHELTARQIDVRWLNRGGGCIMHAPGQLAVYPVLPLDRLRLGLGEYRRRLEQSVIEACLELRIAAFRQPEYPGVSCRCGRVASLGVAVKSWVAYHGLFVNVSPDLALQRLVSGNGCGEGVTSLAAERDRPTASGTVRESLVRHLAAAMGYERMHVYTGHPMLNRAKRTHYVNA